MLPKSGLIAAIAIWTLVACAGMPANALAFEVASTSPFSYDLQRPVTRSLNELDARKSRDENTDAFGSTIIPVGRVAALSQWAKAEGSATLRDCAGATCTTPTGAKFRDAIIAARGMTPLAALSFVNTTVNRAVTYRAEKSDHWASVGETALSGRGDCEDYAIAKRALLIEAGFDDANLQFVVLKDIRRGLQHAVLIAHVDGVRYVLDNLSDTIAKDTLYRNYRPIASIIGGREYLHGFARTARIQTAVIPATLRPAFEVEAHWLSL